ncbi:hypothetical protein [Acidobacterium sp. S8]|uniref:hypothetical protein n=1 Tax=Acidobacterium sp. S8 TaxID=1641854 RepID=UPI00131E8AF5|nr:hypothetical protein [Acidobacterium sp. S8]
MWSDFESDVVEGRYSLGKLVRSEGRCGWFETKFDEQPAVISLTESLNDEAALLERLRAAEKVKDRNVAAILEAGTTSLRETPLVYAVMEFTEENLDDVLRTRALTAEETKEVAESVVGALVAIHKERLVCVRHEGERIEAASVLAAGDTVKLRSDHLLLIAPDAAFTQHAARDVQGLGSLIYQCLTQRVPRQPLDASDSSLQQLPRTFVQVVRRAWSGLATLDEIAALLRPAVAPATSAPPVRPATTEKQEKPVVATAPVAKPVVKTEAVLEDEPLPARRSLPKSTAWIVGGFVVLLLIVAFVVHGMMHSSEAPRQIVVAPPDAAPLASSTPEKTVTKKAAVPTPAPAVPVAAAPAAASTTGNWRVVAYTYNHQDQAEHKAKTINDKHSDLQAGVFSPKGNGAPYLVTLGSPMEKEDAFRLRSKAVHEGLPGDTFARNYSH